MRGTPRTTDDYKYWDSMIRGEKTENVLANAQPFQPPLSQNVSAFYNSFFHPTCNLNQ